MYVAMDMLVVIDDISKGDIDIFVVYTSLFQLSIIICVRIAHCVIVVILF